MRPEEDQEACAIETVRAWLRDYGEYKVAPPSGLMELAKRLGITPEIEGHEEPGDEELLRRYLDPSVDDDGAAFSAIYARYRDFVLGQLVSAGLTQTEAEMRTATVFIRLLDPSDNGSLSLRDLLSATAIEVARDPNWKPY
jgi:hypothetical protein